MKERHMQITVMNYVLLAHIQWKVPSCSRWGLTYSGHVFIIRTGLRSKRSSDRDKVIPYLLAWPIMCLWNIFFLVLIVKGINVLGTTDERHFAPSNFSLNFSANYLWRIEPFCISHWGHRLNKGTTLRCQERYRTLKFIIE